jgi:hypothetical protein
MTSTSVTPSQLPFFAARLAAYKPKPKAAAAMPHHWSMYP